MPEAMIDFLDSWATVPHSHYCGCGNFVWDCVPGEPCRPCVEEIMEAAAAKKELDEYSIYD